MLIIGGNNIVDVSCYYDNGTICQCKRRRYTEVQKSFQEMKIGYIDN